MATYKIVSEVLKQKRPKLYISSTIKIYLECSGTRNEPNGTNNQPKFLKYFLVLSSFQSKLDCQDCRNFLRMY